MSYIRKKISKSDKVSAFEITAKWDPVKKQSRCVSKYLGMIDGAGNILAKGSREKPNRSQKASKLGVEFCQENLIQDFGNAYLVFEFLKKSSIYEPLRFAFEAYPELGSLMTYRLCNPGPMYNCQPWVEGTVLQTLVHKTLEKAQRLSSQNISRVLAYLGKESVQRTFFSTYLKSEKLGAANGKKVIVDATSLPNQIKSDFNAWGHSDDGIERQFRFHCVVDLKTKNPIYYRTVPGNITDVSTLETTIAELKAFGVESSFALLDAGFCSANNLKYLYGHGIDFLTRIPASRVVYKDMIKTHAAGLESLENALKYGKRVLFGKTVKTFLYGNEGYVYIILDPTKKAKDITQLIEERDGADKSNQRDEECDAFTFSRAGIFMLASSKEIPIQDVMGSYYMRQTVEQVFGYSKDDLDMLPIRRHSEATIRGYLFLQFLLLVVFLELRRLLEQKFTVEQALLHARQLKCKIFPNQIVVQEPTRKQKDIFKACSIIVPTSLGI